MRVVSIAAGCVALLVAGAAFAQGGPMSVGLSSDPASRSLHCAAAIYAERYLIQEESLASPFDRSALDAGGVAWAEEAARRAGAAPGAFIKSQVFATVMESKLDTEVQRQAQVKWCLAKTPPG